MAIHNSLLSVRSVGVIMHESDGLMREKAFLHCLPCVFPSNDVPYKNTGHQRVGLCLFFRILRCLAVTIPSNSLTNTHTAGSEVTVVGTLNGWFAAGCLYVQGH